MGVQGMVSIEVRNKFYKFELNFSSKFNFIIGDSGSHKTHFIDLCLKRKRKISNVMGNFKIDNINLSTDQIIVYTNDNDMEDEFYRTALLSRHNSLFIIDEFCEIFKLHDLTSLLLKSDNYFIFTSRKILDCLPADELEVYSLDKDKGTNRFSNRKCI